MGYIRRFFSKKQEKNTEAEKRANLRERIKRFLKDKIGTRTMFSKFFILIFFILIGIAVIIGLVSFKYMRVSGLEGGIFKKNGHGGEKVGSLSELFSFSKRREIKEAALNLKKMKEERLVVGKKTFLVRVAETKREWETGLMWVKKMDSGYGMLFDFGRPVDYGFWMKNTLIPLSILFIGKNMRVSEAVNMEPCKNYSRGGTFYRKKPVCPQFMPLKKYVYAVEINKTDKVSKYIGKRLYIRGNLINR